MDGAV